MLAAGNTFSCNPVVRMEVSLEPGFSGDFSAEWVRKLERGLPILRDEIHEFPAWQLVRKGRSSLPAVAAVELLALLLQRSLGWRVSFMNSLSSAAQSSSRAEQPGSDRPTAVFETRQRTAGYIAGRLAVEICNRLEQAAESEAFAVLGEGFKRFRRKTAPVTPHRSAIAILGRAEQRGIPWSALPGTNFLRLGRGRHAEMLRGYDTSLTSCIASNLAKRKDVARDLLAAAGLPVAEQRSARKVEAAIASARDIGFPVVVKPREGSLGRAVSVNLKNDEEVAEAFAQAQAVSSVVVIESLINGETFRLSVVGGKLFAAAERHPPRLRGDGVHTVEELIAEENKNPERQPRAQVSMEPIELDEEMLALLDEQDLSPASVPEADHWVLLRRVPNPPYGNKTDVTDIVHPTIRTMAERTAALLGISVCGIDFVTTDISRPYEETGGAICEVNTLPDLGLHLWVSEGTPRDGARAVVDMLYPPKRPTSFPIIAVLREDADNEVEGAIRAAWEQYGYKVGVASALEKPEGQVEAALAARLKAFEFDTALDLGIIVVSPRQLCDQGLGYERVDLAVVPPTSVKRNVVRRARRVLEEVAQGRTLVLDDPELAQQSVETLILKHKPHDLEASPQPAEAPLSGTKEVFAPVSAAAKMPTLKRALRERRPIKAQGGHVQTGEATQLKAGNIYARRPVIEIPLRKGVERVVPAPVVQTLGTLLPPLHGQATEFGGWRRVTMSASDVPVAALVEMFAILTQRYVGWPVRFCAWHAEAEQAERSSVDGTTLRTTEGTGKAVFEVATPDIGFAAARVALMLTSALLDKTTPELFQTLFLKQMKAFQKATEHETPCADGMEIAREATQRQIPWSVVDGSNSLQLGSGRFAHVLSGSKTGRTLQIGQSFVRSKSFTLETISAAGLPVPQQRAVLTEKQALDAARVLGFPLRITPAEDTHDQREAEEITNKSGLLSVLRRVQKISQKSILQRVVPGEEYRLLVVDGRLAAVSRRGLAQVRGDGISTIRALVKKKNAQLSRRAVSIRPLLLDQKALAVLEDQGLTPQTVPYKGQLVLLRHKSGDTLETNQEVHAEVRSMAEDAAALLGLDVCGIDFVTTDISRSWRETGGAICAVSPCPSLKLHYGGSQAKARELTGKVLDMLFPKDVLTSGPVVVLVGEEDNTAAMRRFTEEAAAKAGLNLYVVSSVEEHELFTSSTHNVSIIASDKDIDAVLVQVSAAKAVERGLGFERIDLAVLLAPEKDPAVAAAGKVLKRLAGGRPLREDHPTARHKILSALGLLPPEEGKSYPASASKIGQEPGLQPLTVPILPQTVEAMPPKDATATVMMVGDIGFGEPYAHLPRAAGLLHQLDQQGYEHSFANLKGLLASADLLIGNLEVPLYPHTDTGLRGRKKNLGWSDPARTVEALQQAGVSAVTLGNNHSLDCGALGLEETVRRLQAAGIDSFGAGRDLAVAERPFVRRLSVGGRERTLVVFGGFELRASYQQRYRWYAKQGVPGVAGLSPERIAATIAALRENVPAPLFVAFPHWGSDYAEVSDAQRETAARLVEAGIDLVIGHGTHAAQGIEMIDGRPVVFGLGNFIWNAPGRYSRLGARPYSLAAALVFQGGTHSEATLLRLYPIVTNNKITEFQNRQVTQHEFAAAISPLLKGITRHAEQHSDKAGSYVELKLRTAAAPVGVL